uniref:Uncharacterized protein n=1 Tax=Tetranychus urticae TaxID=32264 RepID=T1KXI1_TETUR
MAFSFFSFLNVFFDVLDFFCVLLFFLGKFTHCSLTWLLKCVFDHKALAE